MSCFYFPGPSRPSLLLLPDCNAFALITSVSALSLSTSVHFMQCHQNKNLFFFFQNKNLLMSLPSLPRTQFGSLSQLSKRCCLSSLYPFLTVLLTWLEFLTLSILLQLSEPDGVFMLPRVIFPPQSFWWTPLRCSKPINTDGFSQPHTKSVNHSSFFVFILNHMCIVACSHTYYEYVFALCFLIKLWTPWDQGILSHLCNSTA